MRHANVLFTASQIRERVASLARIIALEVSADVMIVALLRGSFVFAADLIRELHALGMQPQIDFMTISSYGKGTESSGTLTINRDLEESVQDRDVLIIDDILESGRTLHFAHSLVKERGAKTTKIAVLLEKPGKRKVEINADYVGFTIPDQFVVGYGLDYANYYRELPYIGVVDIH